MKISRQEIIAAVEAWHNCHPANSSDDDIKAILTAAYTVRRARKQAKRERQRKEKDSTIQKSAADMMTWCGKTLPEMTTDELVSARDELAGFESMSLRENGFYHRMNAEITARKEKDKQVVESVKPAAVSAFLKDGETVLDRLQRGQRDEVMLMKLLAEEKLKNEALTKMNADQIKHMTERFLGWKLPENFHPDGGITFKATFNENAPHPMKAEPVGTNLFDYSQAKAMVEYMIEGLPISSATPSKAPEWDGTFVDKGEYETNCGLKAIVEEAKSDFLFGRIGDMPMTWHLNGKHYHAFPPVDLIRPWPKGEQ